MSDRELDPVTLEDASPEDRIVEKSGSSIAELDREALRTHREKLLRSQGLSREDVDMKKPAKPPRAELAMAAIYTLYVVPVGFWVLGLGSSQGYLFAAAVIVGIAFTFLILLWRSYVRAWQRTRRARVYEGVLVEKHKIAGRDDVAPLAVFEGGKIEIPRRIHVALIPGVRYRVHAPETDDVAVDVALDDEEPARRSAYR